MKLGVILPSWISDPERRRLSDLCFPSLLQTKTRTLEYRPTLLLMTRPGEPYSYPTHDDWLQAGWDIILMDDPAGVKGVEQALAYGTDFLFAGGANYVTWLGNDTLANSLWLEQLQSLIRRYPNAKAWSVYRSAHEGQHQAIREVGTDVQVTSIGYGMTVEKESWGRWGFDWRNPANFTAEPFSTMDLRHAREVVGERWVTKKSYLEHTGRTGEHCRPDVPEWAIDFQGWIQ